MTRDGFLNHFPMKLILKQLVYRALVDGCFCKQY